MLDLIDRKILFQLDLNCRQSTNKIAKKLNLHRNVILYRINRLEKKGIIRGYFAEINTRILGFLTFRVFIKFSNSTILQESKLFNFLELKKEITWLFRVQGKWDLDFVFVGQSVELFDSFFTDLKINFNDIIDRSEVSIMTQLFKSPKSYLIEKTNKGSLEKIFSTNVVTITNLDKQLLKLLSENARQSILELSKKLNVSFNTVKERLNYYYKNDIVKGFRAFIDTNKSGYHYYRIHINLKHYSMENFKSIKSFLGSLPETIYLVQYVQGADLEVELHLKSEEDLLKLIERIKINFGMYIKEIYYLKFIEEFVYKYLPDLF